MSVAKLDSFLEKPLDAEKNAITRHPVLLTDSKGYSLKNNHQGIFPLQLWAESSKTLQNRIDYLERNVQRLSETHDKSIVYIWAGTCDLTSRTKVGGKPKVAIRNKGTETIDNIKQQVERAFDIVKRFHGKIQIKFVDIQPVSTEKHNRLAKSLSDASIAHAEDLQISDQVKAINKIIRDISKENGAQTVGFYRFISQSRGKRGGKNRYSVNFDLFEDGIHPGKKLAQVFTKVLQEDILKECGTKTEEADILKLNPDSSESDF